MNRLFLLITLLTALTLMNAYAGGRGEAPELPVPEGFSSVSGSGITLQWKVEGENLRVRVAAATDGWIAVGFDPGRRMEDSNIIIGYIRDGQVFIQDQYGTGPTSHEADEVLGGTDDVTRAEGEEENGQTWLAFSIPLDSGDRYDRALEPGGNYQVNLAMGGNDDFGSYHGLKRGVVRIEL